MKKLLLTVAFVFLLAAPLSDGALADNQVQPESIHDVITRMEDSVLLIVGITPEMRNFKGTGVVVRADEEGVIILTAKHVANGGELVVVHNGNVYSPINKLPLGESDAALLFFPPMQGVKALEPNLDEDSSTVKSLSFGYWGKLKELTATAGKTNRHVIGEYFNDFAITEGVIRSSGMLYFGFSGGALVGVDGRLLGINIAITHNYTLAVDIRYIWNNFAHLNKGKLVNYKTDKNFNQFKNDSNNWNRIEAGLDATITNDKGESISVLGLRVLCGKEATENGLTIGENVTKWLKEGFTFTSGDKKYKIIGFEIGMRNKLPQRAGTPSFDMNYAFVCANGYYVLLSLEEINDSE